MTTALPRRADLDAQTTWNLEHLFATPEAWEEEFTRVQAELPALRAFAGQLGDPATVARYFAAHEALTLRVARLFTYASMTASVDAGDVSATVRRDRAASLQSVLAAEAAFAQPELLALAPHTLKEWSASPELQAYAQALGDLERQRPHVRSAEVEELLGLVRGPFSAARTIHPTLVNTDLDLGRVGDTAVGQGNIDALTSSPSREVRRGAWEAYADAHRSVQHTMAACLSAGVRQDVFSARARHYGSSLEAALAPNNLPTGVFHTLIDTYRRHLPTWHRYWRARLRWLNERQHAGLTRLREYDVKAPLSARAPDVPYAQAVEWLAEGMAPLGSEYVRVMQGGLTDQRWVDIYPNAGKRQGAYSTGVPGGLPYIFMSYRDNLQGLSTLAHEIGHSMHSYLTWQQQPFVYSRYSLFVAEVASNFNQAMVRAHLFASQREVDFQVALIEEAMSNFHRYFFVMPTLARFELEIHQRVERGEALSAPLLNDLMADLLQEGYGDAVEMDRERSGLTWAMFSTHLYSNFYVWQYATGISAAHALLARFEETPERAREDYLTFLRAGSSGYPLDVLRSAGVDMLSGEAVEQTFAVLAGYVDRLEALLDAPA